MTHYLLFKLVENCDENHFLEVLNTNFSLMVQNINGFKNYKIIKNCVNRINNFDYMVVMDLTSEALKEYIDHPLHKQMKEQFAADVLKKAVIDSAD